MRIMKSAVKINDVQNEILKVYKEVKRVCDKNKIPFFALGGTKLGAVRRHGFIPWDDDMDLGIKVEDFERFKKACKKDLREPYEFKELIWTGGKVHNKNTTFVETPGAMHRENGYGVFIDIFLLIGTPNDDEQRFELMNNMLFYSFQAMLFSRYPETSTYTKSQILEWRKSILTRSKLSESEKYIEFSFGHRFACNTKGLENPTELPFEDTTILVPSTYDEDLTDQYGDYVKLPPVEARRAHNDYAYVRLNEPYDKYYDKLEKIDPEILEFLRAKHKLEGEFFLNSALFMADGEVMRRRLQRIEGSKLYRALRKIRSMGRK